MNYVYKGNNSFWNYILPNIIIIAKQSGKTTLSELREFNEWVLKIANKRDMNYDWSIVCYKLSANIIMSLEMELYNVGEYKK
jgi:hypothetical protein